MENLGPYVVVRQRNDGTARVLFEVPARHRPENWPPTIPLPLINRTGRLDEIERRRIRQDALDLVARMRLQADGNRPMRGALTWARLVAVYEASESYKALKPASQFTYQRYLRVFVETLDDEPDFAPSKITESQVELVLRMFDHSPDMKASALTVIRNLLSKAVREGDRAEVLQVKTRISHPSRRIAIWEQMDVDLLAEACVEIGHPGLAAIILTQWEIGQRLTDALQFTHGNEYRDGAFRFKQGKTDSYVTIPTPRLQQLLGHNGPASQPLFVNSFSGEAYTNEEAGYWFKKASGLVKLPHKRKLTLRSLRHSCVVQLARAGCTIAEIRSTTGHALRTVHVILEHYLPRDSVCAWNAVEKREKMRNGGTPIGLVVEGDPRTFLGDRHDYHSPIWGRRGSRH